MARAHRRIGRGRSVRLALLLVAVACSPAEEPEPPGEAEPPGETEPPGEAEPPEPAKTGIPARPANPACLAPRRPPEGDAIIDLERISEETPVAEPVQILQDSTDPSRLLIAGRAGRVVVVPEGTGSSPTEDSATFIDIRDRVDVRGDGGLLGVALHPGFADNGEAYLSYTGTGPDGGLESRLSRFASLDGGASLDEASEEILLRVAQPTPTRNGGSLAFGDDGLLYWALGDGGGADEEGHSDNGQRTDTLLGAILRIDVDSTTPDSPLPYGIPPDNPFAESEAGAPEVFAWGFRNPDALSYDGDSGQLWATDASGAAYEEINRVERGGNYGWPIREGTECRAPASDCDDDSLIDPLHAYERVAGARVVGGAVYRGASVPELQGTYLFADSFNGQLWGLSDSASDEVGGAVRLLDSGVSPRIIGQDPGGELYVADSDGTIYRIAPVVFPTLLSQTGCFDPNDLTEPAAGLIGYDLNAPLWSDGATKERYFAIPDGALIDVDEDGDWHFPVGSVLIKSFILDGRYVETRLFVHHDDRRGWAGYTYEWNESQTDAALLSGAKSKVVGDQVWTYPSRFDCLDCHTRAAGRTLGPETGQLNRTFAYEQGTAPQLATYEHIGILSTPLPDSPAAFPAPDGPAPLAQRARAYLHSNCSPCHRPGATYRGPLDFTFSYDDRDTQACGTEPLRGDLGIEDALLVAPGEPERSIISARMHAIGDDRMPPLGSVVVDAHGSALIDAWIRDWVDCSVP